MKRLLQKSDREGNEGRRNFTNKEKRIVFLKELEQWKRKLKKVDPNQITEYAKLTNFSQFHKQKLIQRFLARERHYQNFNLAENQIWRDEQSGDQGAKRVRIETGNNKGGTHRNQERIPWRRNC